MTTWLNILVATAGLVLVAGTFRGRQTLASYLELRNSRKTLLETVENLERNNKEIFSEITKIKASPAYAKKVLRDKYHVTEENETIIFFGD
jgi:cell division protein FtsB